MPQKPPTSDHSDQDTVRDRLVNIRRDKQERVRWSMSTHTAERAMEAITVEEPLVWAASSKSRRRKRHKRLL